MRFLYKIQQVLTITRIEAITLLTLCALFALGAGIKHFRSRHLPFSPDTYAETDSLLQAGIARIELEHASARDSTLISSDSRALAHPDTVPVPAARTTRSTSSRTRPVRMNLNTASARLLQQLPGIGPSLAERIIAWRESHGPFSSPGEIIRVSGIGPKTFEKLEPYLFVPDTTATG